MRKWALLLVLALALVPASALGMASFDYPVVSPVISLVSGNVTVLPTGAPASKEAQVGMLLGSGDTVRTGAGARCEISAATGKMRIYENTEVVIPQVVDEGDKKDIRQVDLKDGTGLFRIRKRGVERGFEVRTPHIIAGVKGTLFAVQVNGEKGYSRVAVYSGQVEVTDLDRTPETKALLPEGRIVEVTKDRAGLGDSRDFKWAEDPWNAWERSPALDLTMPPAEPAGGAAVERQATPAPSDRAVLPAEIPLGAEETTDVTEEDEEREGEAECPPAFDGSGNPIIY